jgi:hypothetical protein
MNIVEFRKVYIESNFKTTLILIVVDKKDLDITKTLYDYDNLFFSR